MLALLYALVLGHDIYVDPTVGVDGMDGSRLNPVKSVHGAAALVRSTASDKVMYI